MSDQGDIEDQANRRSYGKPYTDKHPVPTIQGYREHRAELKQRQQETGGVDDEEYEQQEQQQPQDSKARRAFDSVKAIAKNEDQDAPQQHHPYPTANRNFADRPTREQESSTAVRDAHKRQGGHADGDDNGGDGGDQNDDKKDQQGEQGQQGQQKSATESAIGRVDPKQKRKDMKKIKRHGAGREVTDPVTHLPVIIHDMTDKDLSAAPENEAASGSTHHTKTGPNGASKSQDELEGETDHSHRGLRGMKKVFPPPDFQSTKSEMMKVYRTAMVAGLVTVSAVTAVGLGVAFALQSRKLDPVPSESSWSLRNSEIPHRSWGSLLTSVVVLSIVLGTVYALTIGFSQWVEKRVEDIFDDETWDAARRDEVEVNDSEVELPESVAWLNSLFSSVWPLINPELFASVADMLEDVMQASLPKVIRMVSVDDIGQGSEAVRILGVRWLPTGAASQSVDEHGNLKPAEENDRTSPGEGQIESGEAGDGSQDTGDGNSKEEKSAGDKQREQEQEAIREGMEAEEGDFVNMELAFAYRARSSGKSIKSKATNAHLYLKFYLPGGVAVPVWVELRGIIGIMRLRLQLTPDPPFFSLCTLTFLGQPRANLACVPLSKHSLNVMDVPFISSFVQSAIDAALAEYVAPKSLTLDLKAMLVGDDFKKDTSARGVILVNIKRAQGFKDGDGGIGPVQGSSDSYVTVSWGKYGKPVASTRVIVDEQEPCWDEWASILVTPEEVNAEETLRLQLWDSDKHTADDDLGRIEVSLKELMHSSKTKNRFFDREDRLRAEDPDENMPGSLSWSVGYFAKAHIQQCQLDKQTVDKGIRSVKDLEKKAADGAAAKLQEASGTKDESKEKHQQTIQDFKEMEDEMIISAPPPNDLPSGILSIQIHNITGIEVSRLNRKNRNDGGDQEDEAEQADDLPDSYCTIMMNHHKVYRTRTKPKNANPFFNAGTERFVRDWRTTEIMVSVRDSREGENDPLLGIVYLPLRRIFEKRSQLMETYPIAGGIGYGRARISMVWRSVDLHMPRELTGWDYGTLEVKLPVKIREGCHDESLNNCRIKFRTRIGKTKLQPGGDGWRPKRRTDEDSVYLGVTRRYASPLVLEFRKSRVGQDHTPAFAVLWLNQISDEEEKSITLQVWKGGKDNLKRARDCCNYQGMEEGEKPLGEIEMTLKFWRGLSGYHKGYASKSRNHDVRDVMEVLDTVNDEKMDEDADEDVDDCEYDDDSSTSDSEYDGQEESNNSQQDVNKRKMLRKAGKGSGTSSSSSSGDESNPVSKVKEQTTSLLTGEENGEDDGRRGLRAQVQDYRKHRKQLHRKHHGVMQWKTARTLDWVASKANASKGRLQEMFEHGDKDKGVETEV
ncbi:C2 (Calcium/lipid-binding, CaLB) [Pleurostoma richardsiae]|uniref:C2 (Calcium/lipid-binding, CaLB) n=1 Tax=Pleurostoma richardsiae TaxID=41990 RepID=A0AA38RBX6_9PEZI|nr:C2 (Calcium/lipid-binding, CaLB) [Pleurostoma richardsiae]